MTFVSGDRLILQALTLCRYPSRGFVDRGVGCVQKRTRVGHFRSHARFDQHKSCHVKGCGRSHHCASQVGTKILDPGRKERFGRPRWEIFARKRRDPLVPNACRVLHKVTHARDRDKHLRKHGFQLQQRSQLFPVLSPHLVIRSLGNLITKSLDLQSCRSDLTGRGSVCEPTTNESNAARDYALIGFDEAGTTFFQQPKQHGHYCRREKDPRSNRLPPALHTASLTATTAFAP